MNRFQTDLVTRLSLALAPFPWPARPENATGVESWQVYGLGGELLAEYAANAAATSPQKEYGYRNGKLLITATSTSGDVHWLVSDQLGTPRMIFDKTGTLANTMRHDYLPFGEELTTQGGRDTAHGYGGFDGARQKYTSYERDDETGLDYAHARYYGNMQGRFTSPDPFAGSATSASPQTFNRYTYVENNPVNVTDPTGLWGYTEIARSANTFLGNQDDSVGSQIPGHGSNQFVHEAMPAAGRTGLAAGLVAGAAAGAAPQNSFTGQGQERSDPCSNTDVPYAPPNVNVGDNVRAVRETQAALASAANEDNIGSSMAYGLGAFDTWFYNQVKPGGPWDYKTQTTDERYEAFGNFNYGVVGAASGYSKDTLLRVAGWAQQHGAYAKQGRGQMSPSLVSAFFSRGGVYPYGDQPRDTEQIERGIAYYRCVFEKKPQR